MAGTGCDLSVLVEVAMGKAEDLLWGELTADFGVSVITVLFWRGGIAREEFRGRSPCVTAS